MEAKFVLAFWEFNELMKPATLYVGQNEYGILIDTDEWDKAATFDFDTANEVRDRLQREYPDGGWYVVKLND